MNERERIEWVKRLRELWEEAQRIRKDKSCSNEEWKAAMDRYDSAKVEFVKAQEA